MRGAVYNRLRPKSQGINHSLSQITIPLRLMWSIKSGLVIFEKIETSYI